MSETSSIDYASSIEHISALTAANVPYLWVTTHEESRFIKDLCAGLSEKEIWTWSSYSGLIKYEPLERITRATGELEKSNNPVIALQYIADYKKKVFFEKGETEFEDDSHSVWILKDFNTVLSPPIARQMRDLYRTLVRGRKIVIIVAPVLGYAGGKTGMEPTLEKQITVIPYELPSKEAIEKRVKSVINNFKKVEKVLVSTGEKKEVISYSEDDVNRFTTALQGLTQVEADNAIMTSICHLGKIDEKKLMREKKQIIQRSEILEYIGNTPDLEDVGGLDLAKKYFKLYSSQFSKEAIEFGVEPLRGVLFVGPPGTGKSLICKSVSAEWHLPLIRLDVGKVMGGIVGQSEGNMRNALASAQACAPCVVSSTNILLSNGETLTAEELWEKIGVEDSISLASFDPQTGKSCTVECKAVIRRYCETELLKITTEVGTITVTPNHKFLTTRGWVEAKDLVITDDVLEGQKDC